MFFTMQYNNNLVQNLNREDPKKSIQIDETVPLCKCVYTFSSFFRVEFILDVTILVHDLGSIEADSKSCSSNEMSLFLPMSLQEKYLALSTPFPLKPLILDETIGIAKTEDV